MTKIIVDEGTSVSVDGVNYEAQEDEDHGYVIVVSNGDHAAILTRPPFGLTAVEGDTAQPQQEQEQGTDDTLYGSSILPAQIDITSDGFVQLSTVVAMAHTDSGLSVADWNALPEEDREQRLQAVVDRLRAENAPAPTEESEEVKALRALDFADFPNKTALVSWLNANGVADVDDGMSRPILEGRAGDRRDELVSELTKEAAPAA
jgi:hypothetical protein